MSLLDTLIYGYRTIFASGVEITRRNKVNFVGASAVDNPTTGATDVTIGGGGGGVGSVPMRTSVTATTLVAVTDYHLLLTASVDALLPTTPANGTSFEIKASVGTDGATVTAGGADTIDAAASYALTARENITVRYNLARTDWEIC